MKKYTKALAISITSTTILGAISTSGAFASWGPARDTYTMENPADHAVFNSITNNPTIGDERDFVRVAEINEDVTDFKNSVEVVPGKQYAVWIYFHNDASETYNDEAHEYKGIATGTKLVTNFPTVLTSDTEGIVQAGIRADNTDPGFIWDDATMTTSSKKVYLSYVAGSAKIYNDSALNGTVLPETLFGEVSKDISNGTLIGYNELNGGIPGCEQYHGVVQYVLEAKEHSATVEKTVSKDGENFGESVEIDPEEEVTFKLTVKNTGDTDLTQVLVKDTLPTGLTFVPGSVEFWANDSTTKEAASDDIVANGLTYPSLPKGNTYYITFRAKAGKEYKCDGINMTNKAIINYESDVESGDSDEDTAKVKIKKDECEPEPEEDCTTNPDLPGCKELPNTGPVEIAMAIAIALGIGGGGYYFYRTKKSLKTIEGTANGTTTGAAAGKETTPETPAQIQMEQPKEEKADK